MKTNFFSNYGAKTMSQSSDNAKLIRFLQKNALIENSNKPLLFENNYIQQIVFCHLKHRQQKLGELWL